MATAGEQLVGIGSILNGIKGITGSSQKTSRSTTQTQGSDISEEGIQRLINTMLAGPGGVKDISGAARGAGLYNSTTETQLLNDLNTRVAGEAAARSAKTTTTQDLDQEIETPGMSLGSLALPAAGILGLANFDKISSGVSGLLGGGAAGTAGAITAGTGATLGSLGASTALNALPITAGASAGANIGGAALGSLEGLSATGAGGAIGEAGSLANFLNGGASTAVPLAGNVLSGLLGGTKAATDPLNLGISSLAGAAALGPIGLAAAPLASIAGGLLKDVSIICTALRKRGLLNAELYKLGQSYLQTLHPWTKQGYYSWANHWAAEIEEGNEKYIDRALPWAESRMMLLASKGTIRDHVKYFRGTLTKFVGQPGCFLIGAWINLIKPVVKTSQG